MNLQPLQMNPLQSLMSPLLLLKSLLLSLMSPPQLQKNLLL